MVFIKLLTCHVTANISLLTSLVVLYLPMNLITSLRVVTTGISLLIQISAKWFFGSGRSLVCPSNISKKSLHLVSLLLQQKSFKNINPTLLPSTHPYLSLTGFENVLKMMPSVRGKKVLPYLAGPIIIFRGLSPF